MVKTLMIHEVDDWMLELDLSDYDVLTFDDGLFSQYNNYKHFLKFSKPMYFFISTDIVCPEDVEQNREVVPCSEAHRRYREQGCLEDYMKWSQIQELNTITNCFIGGHGHTHQRLKGKPMVTTYIITKNECRDMCNKFSEHNITIDSFCFPYNEDIIGYRPYLKREGVDKFFGNERISIEIV